VLARRRNIENHANHERWLVSYADFITLLFAFFVVMFSSTQADRQKARAVSESVRQALQHGELSNAIATMLGRGKHDAQKAPVSHQPTPERENPTLPPTSKQPPQPDLNEYLDILTKGLTPELESGKLQLKLEARGLIISMREATFFHSGAETVSPDSMPILDRIATVVKLMPNPVRLEGHTDSKPIHNSRFRNNWELSAARAIAMLEIFRDRFGIPESRMAVAGYAENAPADTNDTDEGRAHNRRVDLILLSPGALTGEPTPTASVVTPAVTVTASGK
jgi:chemotaxis protein MotB